MNILAVLHASEDRDRLRAVKDALECHWVTYKVYGLDGPWRGFNEKMLTLYKAAKEETSFSHLLFIDAYDVAVLGRPDQLAERFLELNHPLVCNAEVNCWPDAYKSTMYPPSPTIWKYLNSGAMMGERAYIKDLLGRWGGDNMDPGLYDQRFVTDKYLEDASSILLDHQCRLFQSLFGCLHLLDLEYNHIHNKETGTDPLIAHYNGGADICTLRFLWDKSVPRPQVLP